MNNNHRFKKDLINLSILTTIGVLVWIGFEIYFKLTKATPPEVSEKILRPLDPDFSEDALEKLKDRRLISETELENLTQDEANLKEKSATESAETQEKEATESSQPEENP